MEECYPSGRYPEEIMQATTFFALLASLPSANAGELVEGDALRVHYNEYGLWNDADQAQGLQVLHDETWVDYTWPGTPFAAWQLAWDDGGSAPELYFASSNGPDTNTTVSDAETTSAEGWLSIAYEYQAGDLAVRKTEAWAADGRTMLIHFRAHNVRERSVTDLRLLYSVDPDQDNSLGTTDTVNELIDMDGDGLGDLVLAVGPVSGYTMAIGSCSDADVGVNERWQSIHDADVELQDPLGQQSDVAIGIRVGADAGLAGGESLGVSFLVVLADTAEDAVADFEDQLALCNSCDIDGDGWLAEECGGSDCDDSQAGAFPGGSETWYDGVDGDCDGESDYDADLDGHDSEEYGGDDCDDDDALVNPSAEDAPYDGMDDDCSGGNDYDVDGDGHTSAGHGGEDCDDLDPDINPDAEETADDSVDSDCDGNDSPLGEIESRCGCSASSPLSASWLVLFAGLILLRRRRDDLRD
ncbi:MAG: hypothetical protein ACI9VR_001794 [Cognaticolwellia sp.]|jgi:uncharacterized protein (TIGR03382 family)